MKTVKPRKRRRRLFQAPLHQRRREFSAPLSAELKKAHNTNSFPVRTGDSVRIMRGDRKGLEGKVSRVDRAKYRVFVEGVTREKVDGTTILVPIHPSKVRITSLNLDDKRRREILKRKGRETELPEKKPAREKKPERSKKQVKKKKTKPKTTKKSGGT